MRSVSKRKGGGGGRGEKEDSAIYVQPVPLLPFSVFKTKSFHLDLMHIMFGEFATPRFNYENVSIDCFGKCSLLLDVIICLQQHCTEQQHQAETVYRKATTMKYLFVLAALTFCSAPHQYEMIGLFQNQPVDSVIFSNVSAFDPDNGRGSTREYSLTVSAAPCLSPCFHSIDSYS